MGKNAIIFGATSGIGKELAKLLIIDGYKVAITGRRENKLKEIQTSNPDKYIIKKHDVTLLNESEKVFNELTNELGTVDLVVYSSGIAKPNYSLEWEKELPTLEVNVVGAVKIYGLAYNFFHKQGYGHLVGISSVAGLRGNRHTPAYFASKAFQNNYLESLWMKAKRSKSDIHITDIAPGFIDTKMALGDTFGMAPLNKATKQIYTAIKHKKKKAYITKRWSLIAFVMKRIPAKLLIKLA
ncbi:MAG: SDR family NAD(P)-dependent oxidoreductase [Flavobacteriaceae bacterium]|nr:SDR family NAD(P)-dependent oxidoreductase [Flavobacteriaceae bacterium]